MWTEFQISAKLSWALQQLSWHSFFSFFIWMRWHVRNIKQHAHYSWLVKLIRRAHFLSLRRDAFPRMLPQSTHWFLICRAAEYIRNCNIERNRREEWFTYVDTSAEYRRSFLFNHMLPCVNFVENVFRFCRTGSNKFAALFWFILKILCFAHLPILCVDWARSINDVKTFFIEFRKWNDFHELKPIFHCQIKSQTLVNNEAKLCFNKISGEEGYKSTEIRVLIQWTENQKVSRRGNLLPSEIFFYNISLLRTKASANKLRIENYQEDCKGFRQLMQRSNRSSMKNKSFFHKN